MTRIWMAGITAAATTLGACSGTATTTQPTAGTANQTIASVPTMQPEVTAVATAGTTGGTAAATMDVPKVDPKNILNLKMPKIDKTQKYWTQGVPEPDPFPATFDPKLDYFAKLHTTKGDITVKFFPESAPLHSTSFIYLSQVGYFDDAPFHRVCTDFMMQGGDPGGTGTGSPAYKIPAEFSKVRKHVKGILSAARGGHDVNSAGSQFFLMFAPYPSLDGQYSIFGQVSDGMDVVEKFHKEVAVKGRPDMSCPPRSNEKIKTVDVFTKDKK